MAASQIMSLENEPVWVKLEPLDDDDDQICDTNDTVAKELYASHVVKDELVIGPESLQPPDAVFNLQGYIADHSDSVPIEQDNKDTLNTQNKLLMERVNAPGLSAPRPRGRPKKRKVGRPKTSDKTRKEQLREARRRYQEKKRLLKLQSQDSQGLVEYYIEITPEINQKDIKKEWDPLSHTIKTEPTEEQFEVKTELYTEDNAPDKGPSIVEIIGTEEIQNGVNEGMAWHETKVKYFYCHHCHFSSRYKQGLYSHLKIHTGEKLKQLYCTQNT